MNTDPFAGILALCDTLGRADQCRLVDMLVCHLGEMAPIPQFEDDKSDAEWWCSMQPHARKATMWMVITNGLSPAQLAKAKEYLEGLENAEPRGG